VYYSYTEEVIHLQNLSNMAVKVWYHYKYTSNMAVKVWYHYKYTSNMAVKVWYHYTSKSGTNSEMFLIEFCDGLWRRHLLYSTIPALCVQDNLVQQWCNFKSFHMIPTNGHLRNKCCIPVCFWYLNYETNVPCTRGLPQPKFAGRNLL
jgi:hypothetical protein